MYRILMLVLLAVAANCAPASFISIGDTIPQAYIPIDGSTPQAYLSIAPVSQPKYQPLLNIQQPASLAPAAISRVEAPKEQYVLFYPGVRRIPLIALREGETNPNIWTQVTNWWTDFASAIPNPVPGDTSNPGTSGTTDTQREIESITSEKKIEPLQTLVPASTMPLNRNNQLYVVSGQPQFYGNFAAVQPALSYPILSVQSLQRARSTDNPIIAEDVQVLQSQSKFVDDQPQLPANAKLISQQPAIIQPIPQLQLRSNIIEPLQRLEIKQQQIPIVNNEPVPEVAAEQLARFLDEARSQETTGNAYNENGIRNDDEKSRAEGKPLEEETSVAQAKPSGVALSGKGGVSSSAPSATSIVGDGGLALASPSAIALSGDFKDDEERQISPLE